MHKNRPLTYALLVALYFTPYLMNSQVVEIEKSPSQIEQEVDAIFAPFDDPAKPGAAVAVVHNGQIIFKKGYGAANLEYGIPNSPSTVFHVASVSKQFTTFSILLLAEENKLSLDDDIRKYIPELHDFGKTITLRHLATHTSGLRDQWALLALAGWRFDDVITRDHIMELAGQQKELNFDPGEKYIYCNTGFTLLAEVVARVSGQSFTEFTRERIFEPLNMQSSQFYNDHEKIVENRAYSYYATRTGFKKKVLSFANTGATSLFTTVEDMSLWALNFESPKVGSSKIFRQMRTLAKLNDGRTFGLSLGQFVDVYKGLNQIQHGGSDAGFRSYIGRFPDQNFAVITLANTASFNSRATALRVVDVFLGSAQTSPVREQRKNYEFISMSSSELEEFTGNFWNVNANYSRQLFVKDDTLRYSRGTSLSDLVPISDHQFKMINVRADLILDFEADGSGNMSISVDGSAPDPFIRYQPSNYTRQELEEFTGNYFSEELSATYKIQLVGDKLVASHLRVGNIEFNPIMKDLFLGNHRYFNKIEYKRSNSGDIMGIRVSGYRTKNIWFQKKR